jgi:hypothetical protein
MKRRSRSGITDYANEAAQMTLTEIDSEIQRCLLGAENGGTSQGRKSFFKRLIWLEQQRENLFGVSAPRRVFRQR